MITNSISDFIQGRNFFAAKSVADHFVTHIKLEGLSISGSIKVKAAANMLRCLELSNALFADTRLIESSSGNLGLALAMICAQRGFQFTCVSDPNISPQTANLIKAYGAKLVIVETRDANGGYLESRIDFIKSMLQADNKLIWVNQYANPANIEAHVLTTGPEILESFPAPDYVFIGAGTTGTLGGVSRFLREASPRTQIIAVDAVGSVTFGGQPGRRHIPGLGSSREPEIKAMSSFDNLVMVKEIDAIKMCHELAAKGICLGGSSGTVLSAIRQMAPRIRPDSCVIAISPDMGDRYVDTIYDHSWVRARFPEFDSSFSTDLFA